MYVKLVDKDGNPIDLNNPVPVVITAGSGTTAERPATPFTGQQYFDTDLGQPIWWDGTQWVDATGTAV